MMRLAAVALLSVMGCGTPGSTWVAGPSNASDASDPRSFQPPEEPVPSVQRRQVTRIFEPSAGERKPEPHAGGSAARDVGSNGIAGQDIAGRGHASGVVGPGPAADGGEPLGTELGVFRNTYYNFPHQLDYGGPSVSLFDARCRALSRVPRAFHDTLCVQGSGSLASGRTVSFARRNCECARTCPRTGQKICFAELDPKAFPWGRGALGTAIEPLRSVAVDIEVIPLGTPLFIPEFVGLPLDEHGAGAHDGCFVAEDRGIKVIGQHVDIFTGRVAMTKQWDDRVPTNQGVTVFINDPKCPGREPRRSAGD